jgi:hypothetical protein
MRHYHKCWVHGCDTPVECELECELECERELELECMECELVKHPVCPAHLPMFQALDETLEDAGWPHQSTVKLV